MPPWSVLVLIKSRQVAIITHHMIESQPVKLHRVIQSIDVVILDDESYLDNFTVM